MYRYHIDNSRVPVVPKGAFKEDDVPAEEFGGNVGHFCSVSYNDDSTPVLIEFYETGVKEVRVFLADTGLSCIHILFDQDNNYIERIVNYDIT